MGLHHRKTDIDKFRYFLYDYGIGYKISNYEYTIMDYPEENDPYRYFAVFYDYFSNPDVFACGGGRACGERQRINGVDKDIANAHKAITQDVFDNKSVIEHISEYSTKPDNYIWCPEYLEQARVIAGLLPEQICPFVQNQGQRQTPLQYQQRYRGGY